MPRRIIEVDGAQWEVAVSGRVTQYHKDEFGLVFSRGTGAAREQRVARYSPRVARWLAPASHACAANCRSAS